mmetsp:Transcript_18481/g.57358  ORF Transcript_18481/g.57358 Transcript_18481/m.57358 type:complete len:220 (-) Transcript_18481:197-856(-)
MSAVYVTWLGWAPRSAISLTTRSARSPPSVPPSRRAAAHSAETAAEYVNVLRLTSAACRCASSSSMRAEEQRALSMPKSVVSCFGRSRRASALSSTPSSGAPAGTSASLSASVARASEAFPRLPPPAPPRCAADRSLEAARGLLCLFFCLPGGVPTQRTSFAYGLPMRVPMTNSTRSPSLSAEPRPRSCERCTKTRRASPLLWCAPPLLRPCAPPSRPS